ncbi:hypothetical protein HD553DRAFT_302318 [Filobasidium floriforme]|uniref:uncharacterized protein n=1 Tax=Filobasidium floriforme TaxID=5210 RepID=UPI001E8D25DC|nr:uncharacterized protein HD553DRAFT_302318 [Filobasidium floriforme]KAH8090396.1 hypothetical protein HD553DRAFT_302318 [Filobasidium floriforme]
MNARPIITRVFASACPTCRNYTRRTATSRRTSLASKYSTSSASPSAAGLGFRVANLPNQNRTSRSLRPILSHLGRSYATASKGPGSSTSIKVIPPTAESLKTSEEFEDAELVPEDQANITVTDDAVKQLAKIASREPDNTKLALRLVVESGGCHGYQYKMDLDDDGAVVGDYIFKPDVQPCVPIVVDIISLDLLKGSTLHFATELIGSSFRLQDNPQAKEGGNCGCGVSWEPK